MIRKTIVLFAAALVLGGSTAVAQHTIPSDLRITLERTTCFGTCPDYNVTITADGSVLFEGREFVKVKGISKSHVSEEDLRKLIDAFDTASYFEMKDKYLAESDGCPEVWTDHPTARTSLRLNGRSKSINHYYGCQEKNVIFPKALTELETKIDEIVGTARWLN